MSTSKEEGKAQGAQIIHTTIQGRQVILEFASAPNLEVADRVKQALLNAYLSARKK